MVADKEKTFILSGAGDVVEPDFGHRRGGQRRPLRPGRGARAAASTPPSTRRRSSRPSLQIAADICIYTNHNLAFEEL